MNRHTHIYIILTLTFISMGNNSKAEKENQIGNTNLDEMASEGPFKEVIIQLY